MTLRTQNLLPGCLRLSHPPKPELTHLGKGDGGQSQGSLSCRPSFQSRSGCSQLCEPAGEWVGAVGRNAGEQRFGVQMRDTQQELMTRPRFCLLSHRLERLPSLRDKMCRPAPPPIIREKSREGSGLRKERTKSKCRTTTSFRHVGVCGSVSSPA